MTEFIDIVFLCIGGAFGALARWLLAQNFDTPTSPIPYGTLAANILASALLGAAAARLPEISTAAATATNAAPRAVRLFAEIGFCASLSTFSSFAFQLFEMLRAGKIKTPLLYVASTFGGGVACFALAFYLC